MVSLNLCKEHLNTATFTMSLLVPMKTEHETHFCVIIYGIYKLFKMFQFFGPPDTDICLRCYSKLLKR